MSEWYDYDSLEPMPEGGYDWTPGTRGDHPDDNLDYHIDLGAGNLRKGRLTVDRHGEVDLIAELDTPWGPKCYLSDTTMPTIGFPFPDNSIKGIITHHCLEHISNVIELIDECYRVLEPNAKLRIIVPLFPSFNSIADVDHKKYFCVDSFEPFCHNAPAHVPHHHESFAVPYTKSRFVMTAKDYTAPEKFSGADDVLDIDRLFAKGREMRLTLTKPVIEEKNA